MKMSWSAYFFPPFIAYVGGLVAEKNGIGFSVAGLTILFIGFICQAIVLRRREQPQHQ